jgi:hypothetical protein
MPKRVSNHKFFTLQRMLTMDDIEEIAAMHACSVSYVTKVVSLSSKKFDLDILKSACERAKENIETYSRRIGSLFQDIERIENYTDEQMKRDIDWFERNFQDID